MHLVHEKYLSPASEEHQIALKRFITREPLLQPVVSICEIRTGALRDQGLALAEAVQLYGVYVLIDTDGLI